MRVFLVFFLWVFLGSIISCAKDRNGSDLSKIAEDYFAAKFEYNIELEYAANSAEVYKIFAHHKMSNDFYPDFIGDKTFVTTKLHYYGTREYMEKYNEYWDNYGSYMNISRGQGFDDDTSRMMFYQIIENEIGKPKTKNVIIVSSKEELEYVETEYINSMYLQEIESVFFEKYHLALISFNFTGWKYPKNWEIENFNDKYLFTVEIWDREFNFAPALLNEALFLIKIKK